MHGFFSGSRIRKFFVFAVMFLSPFIFYAGHQLWQNNRSVDAPPPQAISDSLEKGITWLVNNRRKILNENNPMLWWMISESANITRDERLKSLFSEYKSQQLDPFPGNPWWYLFDPQSNAPITMARLYHLPDYNLYFIYGASCSAVLAQEEFIRKQNDVGYCATYHPFSPACVTHQLMGAQFIQKRGCLGAQKAQDLVRELQSRIVTQLTWDPRVIDVYIQRILMLTQSGAFHQVKPVWLQRVLNAQSADGGWDDFHPVLPVSQSGYVGFAGYGIGIRQLDRGNNLHATAQGVFLMSLVASGTYGALDESQ